MTETDEVGERVVILLLGSSELTGDLFRGFVTEQNGDLPRHSTRELGEAAGELIESDDLNNLVDPLSQLRNGRVLSELATDGIPWRLLLVATDQQDEEHRSGDTITIAPVVEALAKTVFGDLKVATASITSNPALPGAELFGQIRRIMDENVDPEAGESVVLLPVGSTPAMRVLFEQAAGLLPVESTVMVAAADGTARRHTALQLALRSTLIARWKQQVSVAAGLADIGALRALLDSSSDFGLAKSRRKKIGALVGVLSKMVEVNDDWLGNAPHWLIPELTRLRGRHEMRLELPMAMCGAAERGQHHFTAAAYFGTAIESAPQAWMNSKRIRIPDPMWDTDRCGYRGRRPPGREANQEAVRASELARCGSIRCDTCPVDDRLPDVRVASLLTRIRGGEMFRRRNGLLHAGANAVGLDKALERDLVRVAKGEVGTNLGSPTTLHEFLEALHRELFGRPYCDPLLEIAEMISEVIAEV